MMPEGLDLAGAYQAIGQVLGTPAVLLLFWVVTQIKELKTKVKILEKENAAIKEDITDIRVNVSWMRGKMEGTEQEK